MKYIKLLALCLLPFVFSACEEDNVINSGNASVGFSSTEMVVSENTSIIKVPINVEGEHNGLIKVNIEIADIKGEEIKTDETLLLTSGSLLIPEGTETVYAELSSSIYTITDNLNRSFTLNITSSEGAKVSTSSCVVKVEEVPDAYTALAGKWQLSDGDGGKIDFDLIAKEDRSGYDCKVSYQGLTGNVNIKYSNNSLTIVTGDVLFKGVEFDGIGVVDVVLAYVDGNQLYTGELGATWNEDFTMITLDKSLTGALFSGSSFTGYTWFMSGNILNKVIE
ncbi:MAG: hypothetical protein SOX26_05260 [Phocaeicola sp.]|nr:hypothetical protein [Phocaeicola sp.]